MRGPSSRTALLLPWAAGALALLFRVWDLHRVPPGLFFDTASQGLTARMIGETWPAPQAPMLINGWPSLTAYALKAWMWLVGDGRIGLLSFFVAVSLAALPFLFATLRRWSGPTAAVAALFLLAVLRWHVTLSRNGHMAVHIPLAMFGTLFALHRGLETGKTRFFLLAGFFTAYGLYTYQAFKLFPLFLVLFLWRETRGMKKNAARSIAFFAGTTAFLASPLLLTWITRGSLGVREDQLLVLGRGFRETAGLLAVNLRKTLLFFHWKGDDYAFTNIPGHALLDPVTGVLFLAGLVLALAQWRRRDCFHALSGFAVMMLPALLSADGPRSGRLAGAIPFVALLAALPVREAWERVRRPGRPLLAALFGVLALSIAFLNARDYFRVFAAHPDCRAIHSVAETLVGEKVRGAPGVPFVLSPRFLHYPMVRFLAYDSYDRISPLSEGTASGPSPTERLFVLEARKEGWSAWLRERFPGSVEEVRRDWNGAPLFRVIRVPAGTKPDPASMPAVRVDFYSLETGRPVQVSTRMESVVEYSFRGDFPPLPSVFRAIWRGEAAVPEDGVYEWAVLTSGTARLRVARKVVADTQAGVSFPTPLKRGSVVVELEYQAPGPAQGMEATWFPSSEMPLYLVWKRPGASRFEPVRFNGVRRNTVTFRPDRPSR